MKLLFLIFNFKFLYCYKLQATNYDSKTKFNPDNRFNHLGFQLMELRDLAYYNLAWCYEPENLFANITKDYTDFYMSENIEYLKKVLKNIPRDNRGNEIFTILVRYALCFRKQEIYRNCPNPCNNQPCNGLTHAYNTNSSNCKTKEDSKKSSLAVKQKFPALRKIFEHEYDCLCSIDTVYNATIRSCVAPHSRCENIKQECSGVGTCFPRQKGVLCLCPPAFKGAACELYHDTCETKPCGEFKCVRDPSNYETGYRCECGVNYQPVSEKNPLCVDRNECEKENWCNNGTCENINGGYKCNCKANFVGERCQLDMTDIYNLRQWANWGVWSGCSLTCGRNFTSIKVRYRVCGEGVDYRKCAKTNDSVEIEFCKKNFPRCLNDYEKTAIVLENPATMYPINRQPSVFWNRIAGDKLNKSNAHFKKLFGKSSIQKESYYLIFYLILNSLLNAKYNK